MRIGVLGAGYVGLVTGTCLAEMGNDVAVVDIAPEKIEALQAGRSPHYEPGLDDLLVRSIRAGRLHFSTEVTDAVADREVIFLAVGTPQAEDGSANLSHIEQATREVAAAMDGPRVLIIKSTVPVGTNERLARVATESTTHPVEMVSNPEFLKEGAAVDDFMKPDRVVVGVRSEAAERVMRRLYEPFLRTGHPLLIMNPESAEMVKYCSNALLASRISFMNEMAAICSKTGADVELVRKGVGSDRRIGSAFLFAGLGYGGSCFPKDVKALAHVARELGLTAPVCEAVDEINTRQRFTFLPDLERELGGDLSTATIALWGLAFKPRTDDVREAPALDLARALVERGARVVGFDPEAMKNARKEIGECIVYAPDRYSALDGADALIICTEWNEFRSPDFKEMTRRMKRPLIFDGRNLYSLDAAAEAGLTYYSIGRPPAKGTA